MNLTEIVNTYEEIYKTFGGIRNCTIICCADHGVAAENVSAYPKATTAQMVKNYLISQGAAANAFADFAHSELIVVDVGVDADINDLPEIVNRKIARGTNNIAKGPAMTIEQAMEAIDIGVEIVKTTFEARYNCYLPGEMGIANTTSSAALAAMLLNLPVEEVTGRGTNISDERFKHKIEVVKRAVEINSKELIMSDREEKYQAIEILSKVGGFETACMVGIYIGAWQHHSLAIIDGFNSAIAALIACKIVPDCRSNMIASHIGREKGHKLILDELELQPMLNLNLAIGEAIGSSIVANILDKLSDVYDEEIFDNVDNNDDDDEENDFNFDFNFDNDDDDDEEDDDKFEIELNIYDTPGMDQRFQIRNDDDSTIEFKYMGDENISVTDRTFNFYLNTMPRLDKSMMDRCQKLIDNLSKPYGSLGLLEEIAIQTAGISGEEIPSSHLKSTLICFTDKYDDVKEYENCIDNDEEPPFDNPLCNVVDTAESFDVDVIFGAINNAEDLATVFDFGRMIAEDISFKVPIVGIAIINDISHYEDITEELISTLLTDEGKLKYNADEFLKYVPKIRQNLVSGVIGAIISAVHNGSLIVVDSGAVDIIARYLEKLCPEVQQYILHASRLVVNDVDGDDDELDGEVVFIGIEIVYAALHALNEMKSFKDTGVDIAIDGAGSFYQSQIN